MSDVSSENAFPRPWANGYNPPQGYFDEVLDERGDLRLHWQSLANRFGNIDESGWEKREQQLERLIRDNGVTYNVYGDQEANLRPWSLDMVPLAITENEFETLESALSQRAHLLNLILHDVYGRQTMLQNGKMHPYLVFANPSFSRPCHGLLPPRHRYIHLYAADLARSPDGSWWVLADRVEAASGLGYALENRLLMSRVLPKVMWDSEIHSLQPFVQHFCQYMEGLAPKTVDSPTVALLTAGPKNETYFEQSFLARNLGYPLVEGADLTVRSNHLYMKTIGGVQRIDALWRRVDSPWCDPLELKNESLLGTPGLLNAVRQGNVAIANSLGAGFVETTAMLAFLPWFCRNYLGESLELPSVATWWCGQYSELVYVIDNIDRLAIKPTFWGNGARSFFGPNLSFKEKEELIAAMRRNPERYCGQEIVSNSTIPVRNNAKLKPRHFQLRVFLAPSGHSWKMMPGGLVRFASKENDLVVSMQHGGESKDAWVLRDPQKKRGKRATPDTVVRSAIRRNSNDLPSRTAENLFWLGRYVERAEALTRLLRTLDNLIISDFGYDSSQAATPFLEQIIEPDSDLSDLLDEENQLVNFEPFETLIIKATYDRENAESLLSNLRNIERSASAVKERLSIDAWKRLIAMRDLIPNSSSSGPSILDDRFATTLERVLDYLASFVGNLAENMTRSQGWRFLQIGRRLERALAISYLLRSAFTREANRSQTLQSRLLDWADSSITYRRRFLNTLEGAQVLELLCFDSTNPRSLAFQIEELRSTLAHLPHHAEGKKHLIDTLCLRLYSRLGLGDSADLLKGGAKTSRKTISSFFDELIEDLLALALAIEQSYFAHTALSQERQAQTMIG